MKDRMIHGESNVWSTSQRQKRIYGFDIHVGFELNYGSVGYGKQCSLAWLCAKNVQKAFISHVQRAQILNLFKEGYSEHKIGVKL